MKYSNHSVYINNENEEVPSVTTILKILNKPFLSKWANILGFKREKIEDVLEKSSILGTQVHKIIECYLLKKYYIYADIEDKITKNDIIKHFNCFVNWTKNHNIDPIFMEKKFCSKLFGGTVDFYGNVDGKLTILDFKTSKKLYPTMFLQLGAYTYMLEEKGYVVEKVAIVIVNSDKCFHKEIEREKIQKYIDVFLMLANLFHAWYVLNITDGWGDIIEK